MDIDKNIQIFIEDQFSANYRDNGALLVEFMTCYYKWMKESGNPIGASRNLLELYDPDTIAEEFLDFLHNEFLGILPKTLNTNKRTLIKNILKFYQARGTEDAYKMLFRILYNQEINLYYPGRDVLRLSDGKWYVGKKLNILLTYNGNLQDIPEIIGVNSGAVARIENSTQTIENQTILNYIYLINIRGTFQSGEIIKIKDTETVIGTVVGTLITEPGYYLNNDGKLSSDKYFQDNFYYQDFSYEIQSSIPIIDYREIANQVVHPAGTKLFGKVLNSIDIESGIDVDSGVEFSFSKNYSWNIASNTLNIQNYNIANIDVSIDKNRIEYAGSGIITINNGQIQDFPSVPISDFGITPISLIGTRNLLFGTGTQFISEIGQTSGIPTQNLPANIKIFDDDNGAEVLVTADYTYANRFQSIVEIYPYTEFLDENYNIVRTVEDSIANSDYISSNGTATISWSGSGDITGTGTSFSTEIDPEDIIYIPSTDDSLLVTTVISNTALKILWDDEIYSFSNVAYKIIKNS